MYVYKFTAMNLKDLTDSSLRSFLQFAMGTLSCWGDRDIVECCGHEGAYLVCNSVWVGSLQDIALSHSQCYSLHLLVISVSIYGHLLISHSFIL